MEKLLKIEVSEALRAKMPKHYRYIPRFVVKWLERVIHQDELNQLLLNNKDKRGVDFAQALLHDLEVTVKVVGDNHLPAPGSGRYIFASNHPLGGLDGIALIALLGRHYHGQLRFIVNDLLMQITPFSDIFLPANKLGRQSHQIASRINQAMAGDCQIATFPAGLCSRRRGGVVSDLQWTKGFIGKSIEYQRDVVPVFFDGLNSNRFYRTAQLRERLGIKFNAEMILLPGEMFRGRGSQFTVHIGEPISWKALRDSNRPARELADEVKQTVYNLKNQ